MPENLEKFTSPDQSKKTGKLTPEEIKEMVKKFKEEHGGLLPEYFSLPGEEKEEREYSEETILAYEIEKFLEGIRPKIEDENLIKNVKKALRSGIEYGKEDSSWSAWSAIRGYTSLKQLDLWSKFDQEFRNLIEENIKHPQLIKNAGKVLKSNIDFGQESNQPERAWYAIYIYASFKQSGLWLKLDQEFRKWVEENITHPQLIENAKKVLESNIKSGQESDQTTNALWATLWAIYIYTSFKQSGLWLKLDEKFRDWVEKNIKHPQLIENAKKALESNIESGQKADNVLMVLFPVRDYASFSQFQKILEEQGRKKERAKESQKAMHPERKLPPIPEEREF